MWTRRTCCTGRWVLDAVAEALMGSALSRCSLQVMLYPDREPYNKGAFRVSIEFPAEYPFKPPRVTFMTKVGD